jgi:hypothetical protein
MIFGAKKQYRVIASRTLPGYGAFITEHFQRNFIGGEPLVIYYPPDHPNEGTKYNYTILENDDSGAEGLDVVGLFGGESTRSISGIEDTQDPPKPYHLDFYIIPFVGTNQDIHPLTNENGYDCFLLKASIIEGLSSGARRFYDGPFKGYSIESQDVCIDGGGDVSLNTMDGSTCEGYLRGSYYEGGYSPIRHNIHRYAGVTNHVLDPVNPINQFYMSATPFGSLSMNWLALHNRENRPIPYRMQIDGGKGHAAALITKRHAVISGTKGYGYPYRFYSPSEGIVNVSVEKSTATVGPFSADLETRDFKNIWRGLGFRDPTGDVELTTTYNALMESFRDCTIVTFDKALPDDIVPVYLVDRNESDLIRWAMTVGQEGRGHVTYTCDSIKESARWQFSYCPKCDGDEDVFLPPGCDIDDVGKFPVNGDLTAPLYTYSNNEVVFLGFMSEIIDKNFEDLDFLGNDNTIMSRNSPPNYECFTNNPIEFSRSGQLMQSHYQSAWDIGNTKKYQLPWGYEISAFDLLNMWLALDGDYQADSIKFQATDNDTQSTYPYPIIIDEGEVIEPGDRPVPPQGKKIRNAPWNIARTYREE